MNIILTNWRGNDVVTGLTRTWWKTCGRNGYLQKSCWLWSWWILQVRKKHFFANKYPTDVLGCTRKVFAAASNSRFCWHKGGLSDFKGSSFGALRLWFYSLNQNFVLSLLGKIGEDFLKYLIGWHLLFNLDGTSTQKVRWYSSSRWTSKGSRCWSFLCRRP